MKSDQSIFLFSSFSRLKLIQMAGVIACLYASHAHTAEIETVEFIKGHKANAKVAFDGPVVEGDQLRLAREIKAIKDEAYKDYGISKITVSFNSPGGSYPEGLQIAQLIANEKIQTVVENGNSCYSACALAFMAGSIDLENGAIKTSRTLHPTGVLGFHAPYLNFETEETFDDKQIKETFAFGVESIRAFLELSQIAQIDAELVIQTLNKGPSDFFTIKTVDDFGRWNIDYGEEVDALEPKNYEHIRNLCVNSWAWYGNKVANSYPGYLTFPYSSSAVILQNEYRTEIVEAHSTNRNQIKFVMDSPLFGHGLTCMVKSVRNNSYDILFVPNFLEFPIDELDYTEINVPSWAIRDPDDLLVSRE